MTLWDFCLENVGVLDAAWPSSGQDSLFPHTAFHGPGLQRGLVPGMHSTWIYHAFVSREVHFSLAVTSLCSSWEWFSLTPVQQFIF